MGWELRKRRGRLKTTLWLGAAGRVRVGGKTRRGRTAAHLALVRMDEQRLLAKGPAHVGRREAVALPEAEDAMRVARVGRADALECRVREDGMGKLARAGSSRERSCGRRLSS